MKKISFNSGWLFHNDIKNTTEIPVTLPHDAMQTERRLPGMKNGAAAGFFPGGRYIYRKLFTPEERWKDQRVILELEGVYRRSTVLLNGKKLGGWVNGYTGYTVDLTDALRKKADFRWSFSSLTFTHQMIRVLLAEQIYRAFKISRGEKYHW